MAKPRVFISSTFYDLKTIRLELDKFLKSLGYESVRNEKGDIPYGSTESMQSYCYKEISNIDILVSIIGSRFGSPSENDKSRSVSNIELKTAIEQNKHVFIFIEKSVFIEYETYLLNEDSDKIKYRYVDNANTYKFIKEIKALKANNNIKEFENVDDIISYLREQFAGLMKQFFIQEQRLGEINLIKGINSTASTLKELVDYIQNTNESQKENLKEIIKTFHPIIGELKEMLHIPYKFYIEEYKDLKNLLESRGFNLIDHIQGESGSFVFEKEKDSISSYRMTIDKFIFDKDMTLKPFQPNEWKYSFIKMEEHCDELPF
jgi:hypothetical protein|nr:MAG TPA: protein of unknown function (DUF4062) [Caudoviricetes sp.]